jgi:hypothetical protein
VPNDSPLGCPLPLAVHTVNSVQTPKENLPDLMEDVPRAEVEAFSRVVWSVATDCIGGREAADGLQLHVDPLGTVASFLNRIFHSQLAIGIHDVAAWVAARACV